MTYATLKLCSGRGSFEAVPRPKLALDLATIATRLRASGYAVTDARVLLIARRDCEITLAADGRVLLKVADPLRAATAFEAFRAAAGLPDAGDGPAPPPPGPARVIPP